jgi:hypothetical protein
MMQQVKCICCGSGYMDGVAVAGWRVTAFFENSGMEGIFAHTEGVHNEDVV